MSSLKLETDEATGYLVVMKPLLSIMHPAKHAHNNAIESLCNSAVVGESPAYNEWAGRDSCKISPASCWLIKAKALELCYTEVRR